MGLWQSFRRHQKIPGRQLGKGSTLFQWGLSRVCRYRIDNYTSQTLALRQKGCKEATDTLKPHSALHYAWDEPSLPHLLMLELPGRRVVGTFPLDKVLSEPWNRRQKAQGRMHTHTYVPLSVKQRQQF